MRSLLFLACTALTSLTPAVPAFALSTTNPNGGTLVGADTADVMANGTRFVAPSGWSIERTRSAVTLSSPEGDSRIALVDVKAENADAAVEAAWLAYDPKTTWTLKQSSDRAKRNGWDQIRGYQYEVPVAMARRVSVQTFRSGSTWTVAINDMSIEVAEKRSGQVDLIYGKLWPKGYSPETFAGKTAHKLAGQRMEALKQFMDDARRTFNIPGVAIGVVQDGKVVFAGGLGVREMGKPEPVDANTLFMIASNNKALTTLLLAKEVDAGKFTWDTPVTKLMPTFRLGDAATTEKVQMKHLVCACTGMPRQDMETIFNSESTTPASIMSTLATMQPTSGFGELYQYSNSMAAAAGFIGGHVLYPKLELGAAYDKAMQTQVFDPLGMVSTTFDFDRALRGNYAAPHARNVHGQLALVDMDILHYVTASRPDGGAWSNVNDMLRYVRMELAKGELPDGRRYIGQDALLARYKQQVSTGGDTGYAMGLKIDRSWGIPIIHHGGSESGYRSDMVWLPEHGVGAVILTNSDDGVALRYQFRRRLVELLFDGKPEAGENVIAQSKRLNDTIAAQRRHVVAPSHSPMLGRLAKHYRNADLGDIVVVRNGELTTFDFGGWKSQVDVTDNGDGSFTVETISPGKMDYTFIAKDQLAGRSLVLDDGQHEYVFNEVN